MPEILKIVVLTNRSGCDLVYLYFNANDGVFPYTENLCAKFEVAKGNGLNYVKEHFHAVDNLEVIECSF